MARNEEKSQSMLNRWLQMKNHEAFAASGRGVKTAERRRPFNIYEANTIADCDKWRSQVLREIGRKVTEIQNSSLSEQKLKQLNDEINKLIREKSHWEKRISDLGGPNYGNVEKEYKYFGEAKNLPGAKDHEKQQKDRELEVERKAKKQLDRLKRIDADYFGFKDDEDGILEKNGSYSRKKRD